MKGSKNGWMKELILLFSNGLAILKRMENDKIAKRVFV